nr:hypothetical protein [Gammaproteobacteria bacterium]
MSAAQAVTTRDERTSTAPAIGLFLIVIGVARRAFANVNGWSDGRDVETFASSPETEYKF